MMWGLVDPRTCHTPLSHLRKVEVRLSPPSVEGATIVLHINNSVFFSRNQLELEARPVLYQRPRNYKQWMPRLAMLHAPLMGRPLWGPGSSPSDSSYTHPFPWTMFIHPASMSRPGSLPHGRLPKTLPSSPGCPHLCPSPYPSLLRGGGGGYQSMSHFWRSQVDQPGSVPVGSQSVPCTRTLLAEPSTSKG